MGALTIGQVARDAGVGVETVRFYERRGLVERPARPPHGGVRAYPAATVARIRFIREAQQLGFSLAEVAELLSLRAAPAADCAAVRARTEDKLAEVERKIAGLERIRLALAALIAACPGEGALDACTIVEALDAATWTPEGRPAANGPVRRPARGGSRREPLAAGASG